jgi:SAM-dependent methyltransferase
MFKQLEQVGETRGDFVTSAVHRSAAQKVLDIGCGPGYQLVHLQHCERWGVDMDAAILEVARNLDPGAHLVHQTGAELPFEAESFDAAILSEVIEHVGDQNKALVIDEAHRVLRPGGTFVFTAPYAGAFAWADPLDAKRRLPALYRLFSRLRGRQPQTPIEIGHQHVSDAEIAVLFAGRFVIESQTYSGPLTAWLVWLQIVASELRFPSRIVGHLNWLRSWESGIRCPRWLAYNTRLVARRQDYLTAAMGISP